MNPQERETINMTIERTKKLTSKSKDQDRKPDSRLQKRPGKHYPDELYQRAIQAKAEVKNFIASHTWEGDPTTYQALEGQIRREFAGAALLVISLGSFSWNSSADGKNDGWVFSMPSTQEVLAALNADPEESLALTIQYMESVEELTDEYRMVSVCKTIVIGPRRLWKTLNFPIRPAKENSTIK